MVVLLLYRLSVKYVILFSKTKGLVSFVKERLSGFLLSGSRFKSQIDNRLFTMLYSKNVLIDFAGIFTNCCSLYETSLPWVVELELLVKLLKVLVFKLPELVEVDRLTLLLVDLLADVPNDALEE